MSLKIIKQGMLDTIQDLGRSGYRQLGINPGGAMDQHAAQLANFLVGNESDAAVIEMHFPAAAWLFNSPALIALAGADFQASLNGEFIPNNHPVLVNKNSILQFHRVVSGARAYLAARGGFSLEKWMGSYSTHLKAKAGGWYGRSLARDDEIGFNRKEDLLPLLKKREFRVLPWSTGSMHPAPREIFILPGHEWDWLEQGSKEILLSTDLMITAHSDRMAYHLDHIPFEVHPPEIVSAAVNFGTVQLLPAKKMIILMADHQTTGGYPRVAHVISAHLSRLAQLKAGERIRFAMTDPRTAEELLFSEEQELLQLKKACASRLSEFLN